MNLDDLKKEIPFKWRVQSFSKHKETASCVAYVDARDVQDILDKVCGQDKWQCKYEEHKGNLFCSIGVLVPTKDQGYDLWVWKSDCGTESNVEKQKGEASDAFKRAAVMWGVGRFLYAKDIVYLKSNEKKTSSNYPYAIDGNGQKIWDITKHCNGLKTVEKPAPVIAIDLTEAKRLMDTATDLKELGARWTQIKNHQSNEVILKAKDDRKKFLTTNL